PGRPARFHGGLLLTAGPREESAAGERAHAGFAASARVMSAAYPHVFAPITIGPVEVKNRIFIPPHGLLPLSAGGPHGSLVPSDQWAHYFAERAAAGVGLIIHS